MGDVRKARNPQPPCGRGCTVSSDCSHPSAIAPFPWLPLGWLPPVRGHCDPAARGGWVLRRGGPRRRHRKAREAASRDRSPGGRQAVAALAPRQLVGLLQPPPLNAPHSQPPHSGLRSPGPCHRQAGGSGGTALITLPYLPLLPGAGAGVGGQGDEGSLGEALEATFAHHRVFLRYVLPSSRRGSHCSQ